MQMPSVGVSFDNIEHFPDSDGFRSEIKYTLGPSAYLKLRDLCAGFMQPDKNAGADGEYVVKSYYFDTPHFRDYTEKLSGIYARQKYRIRTYDDSKFYRLEKKVKRGSLNRKISGVLSYDAANKLILGHMDTRTGDETTDAVITEMQLKGCRNSLYIRYTRQVYILDAPDIRITFDTDLGMLFGNYSLDEDMPDPIGVSVGDEAILEVKSKDKLPGWLKKAITGLAPSEFSVSKYAQSLNCYLE